jgi:porin
MFGPVTSVIVLFLLLVAACPIATADTPPASDPPPSIPGLTRALTYLGAGFANLGGGVRRGGTYTGVLDLKLTFDGGPLFGWNDTLLFVDGLWIHGGQPSNFIGDAGGLSNISAPTAVKLYEVWVEKSFFENQLSALAGLYDLSSEFYRLQSAGLFVNSSFGTGPEFSSSGLEGPSIFPSTSVGARFAMVVPPWGMVLRAAILNGVPVDRPDGSRALFKSGDGILVVAEADVVDRDSVPDGPPNSRYGLGRSANLQPYANKVAVGGWYYSAAFDDLVGVGANGQPVRHRGSGGFYAMVDRVLFRTPEHPEQVITGFLQAGYGDFRVNRFGAYVGAGLTAVGMIAGRDDDALGFAVAYARNGSHYMSAQRKQGIPVTAAETAIEITYLMQLTKWLAVQPDLQYIVSPGTNPTIPNAFAVQLRFAIAF